MLQNKLIDREGIRVYKQISKTVVNDDRLNDIIILTQIDDIRPLLGEELFNDIINNASNYTDLLDGGAYDYNGKTYQNYGLKAVLAYYVYARYAMFGAQIDTPFGLVEKLGGNESERVDTSFKKTMYQTNRQSAFNIWLNVNDYLIRNNVSLFGSCGRRTKGNFKFRKIQ